MSRFRLLSVVFVIALVAAACAEGQPASTTTPAAEAMEHSEDEAAHEEDAEHSEDEAAHEEDAEHSEDEAAHEDDTHEEEAEHSEDEAAHEDDTHEEGADDHSVEGLSVEYIPEAIGEVEGTYTVHLSDFAFDVTHLELTPGMTVEFTIINEGNFIHELRLTTAHRAEEHVASGHEDHGSEGEEGHHGDRDIIINVEPGETRVVTMTLPDEGEGFDQMACLIPGHYELGMFLEL